MPIPVSAPPFPFDAVRDLLGVVRTIYVAAKEGGSSREELARIAQVGKELSRALDLAGSPQQGASGLSAAWKVADKAMLQVNDLVDPLTPAAPLLMAARSRVTGSRLTLRSKPQGR